MEGQHFSEFNLPDFLKKIHARYKELLLLVYMINGLLEAMFVRGLYLWILSHTNISKTVTFFRLLVGHKNPHMDMMTLTVTIDLDKE